MKYKLLSLVFLSFLSACASEDPIQISSKPVVIDVARAADPTPVTLIPVHFNVVTQTNYINFEKQLATIVGPSPVFIAITIKDYENLSLNLADLKRYIAQQKAVIDYYRSVTNQDKTQTQPVVPTDTSSVNSKK